MDEASRIAAVDEIPADTTLLFTAREADTGEEQEAILVGLDGGVAGWLNHCQHFTHIRLDKGSGAQMRDDEIVCTNHGAMFEVDTGRCTFGPCEGAYLGVIEVTVEDGAVYLTDPDYEFVGLGPTEEEPWDLSSKSNLEF